MELDSEIWFMSYLQKKKFQHDDKNVLPIKIFRIGRRNKLILTDQKKIADN